MAAADDDQQEPRPFLDDSPNVKAFYVDISPSQFTNSPRATEKYLSYLKVLDWDTADTDSDHAAPDVDESVVIDWAVKPFEPFLAELAPDPAPGDVQVTLREYLYPKFFVFELDILDEEARPRRIETESPRYRPPGVELYLMHREGTLSEGFPDEGGFRDEGFFDGFLDDVKRWTRLYDPAEVMLSFEDPGEALFRRPRKVLVDDGQTACFFKQCHSPLAILKELRAYKRIAAANLGPEAHIKPLHGVVWDDERGHILGLLMRYLDNHGLCRETIFNRSREGPPAHVRERWATQISTAVAALHGAGIVWGDVEPHHVLVDRDDNAWITHFGGGYTEGWVHGFLAGTVEGDLAGVAKVKEYIFHPDPDIRFFHKHI